MISHDLTAGLLGRSTVHCRPITIVFSSRFPVGRGIPSAVSNTLEHRYCQGTLPVIMPHGVQVK